MRSWRRLTGAPTGTSGTISSGVPRPRPPCGAIGTPSIASRFARACCAMCPRSTPPATSPADPSGCPWRLLRSAAWSRSAMTARSSWPARHRFGVPFFLSSVTKLGLEAVASAAAGAKVFQLYVRGDEAFVDDHVRRAINSGYDAFCLTVDTAIYSRRERDLAKRFVKPWRERAGGMEFQAALNWRDVRRFKDKHHIPLILKGIAT